MAIACMARPAILGYKIYKGQKPRHNINISDIAHLILILIYLQARDFTTILPHSIRPLDAP